MGSLGQLSRKVKLKHLIFLLLFVSGLIPLATISVLLTRQNIEILETQEQTYLTRSARVLSRDLSEYLETVGLQIEQLGEGFLALPGPDSIQERLRVPETARYFGSFMVDNQDRVVVLRILDLQGVGPSLGPAEVGNQVVDSLDEGYRAIRGGEARTFDFVRTRENRPLAVLSKAIMEPVDLGETPPEEPSMIVQAVVDLDLLEQVFRREAQGEVAVFLIDSEGRILWAEGADDRTARAVASSSLVRDFVSKPLNLTAEYTIFARGKETDVLGRVSPVEATGWGLVVQKPVAAAYEAVQQLVTSAVVSSLVLVGLALVFGAITARRFSAPVQRLAETTHEIALGNFGRRISVTGPGREVVELAEDFNRMSGHVERYVEKLKEAARENRELFISSIRAFAAAVDAKDPYTRGHSERVARYSRTIAEYLGMPEEFQQRIWISGILHDVGKIGIEDRILKKHGVLTAEEYEHMKEHPVIGAEIIAPVAQLKEMIPAVRWHHEAWNGKGYPDGLQGEEIPLIARIVAVADTFDAITTNRPYQNAFTPEYGVETITKLTGARFDAKVVTAFLRAFQEDAIRVERAESTGPAAVSA